MKFIYVHIACAAIAADKTRRQEVKYFRPNTTILRSPTADGEAVIRVAHCRRPINLCYKFSEHIMLKYGHNYKMAELVVMYTEVKLSELTHFTERAYGRTATTQVLHLAVIHVHSQYVTICTPPISAHSLQRRAAIFRKRDDCGIGLLLEKQYYRICSI